MVKIGNAVYFSVIAFAIIANVILYVILRKKTKDFSYKFILIWCFACFALHFLKQLGYMSVESFRKSTAENICAVSTLVFPFIMLNKKQGSIHDFMLLIGVAGGIAGLVYPTEAINKSLFCFESLRFFFCHISLFSIPIQLALLEIFNPNRKNFWKMPIYFLGYEAIICLNTAMLLITGLQRIDGMTFIEAFLDRNLMNNSFVFGPTDDMGAVSSIIGAMCPSFMKTDIFGIYGGKTVYWPVIWLTVPSFAVFVPLYFIVILPLILRKKYHKKI